MGIDEFKKLVEDLGITQEQLVNWDGIIATLISTTETEG